MSSGPGTLLVVVMLVILAVRTIGPVKARAAGTEKLVVRTRFIDRVLMNRVQLLGLVVILILGSGTFGPRWISHSLFLVAVGAALVLLSVPLNLVFTTEGFNPHTGSTRAWSDFSSYRMEGRRVVLTGASAWRQRVTLYMAAATAADLERVMRNRGLRPLNRATVAKPARARR